MQARLHRLAALTRCVTQSTNQASYTGEFYPWTLVLRDDNSQPQNKAVSPFKFTSRFLSAQANFNLRSELISAVADHARILKLREALDDESENSLFMPFSRFVDVCKESAIVNTVEESEEICTHLHKSGVILRIGDVVYLHPEDVTSSFIMVLPKMYEDVEKKLEAVDSELNVLEVQHKKIERSAKRSANLFLSAGAVILSVQLAAFIWLTWWELSWDVMEPFGYIISLFYSLVAYGFFLGTRGREFDLEPFWQSSFERLKASKLKKLNFDKDRYDHLLRLRAKYMKSLSASPVHSI